MMMRKLAVKRLDFQEAFELGDLDMDAYLDIETGSIILISGEEWRVFEYQQEGDDTYAEVDTSLVAQVEGGLHVRYLPVEKQNSREGYRDMEIFIAALDDEHVREVLEIAIQGSGAFRRFKDALYRHADVQKAWFAFRDKRIEMRMKDWFERQEIEVLFV